MARRGLIIGGSIASGAVIIAVVAVVIALNIVNNRAEGQVNQQLEQAIEQSPMAEALSYKSVDVQSARGTVEISGIKFQDEGSMMSADTVAVQLPRGEALALARNPQNATITDVELRASGFTLSGENEEIAFDVEELGLQFQGSVPAALFSTDNPEAVMENTDPGVTSVSMSASGYSFEFPDDTGSMTLGGYDFEAKGDLNMSDLMKANMEGNYASLLWKVESVSVELSDFGIELTEAAREEMLTELETTVGPMPLLEAPENWKVESMAISGGMTDEGIELSNVSGKSNLIEFEGSGSMGLSSQMEPLPPLEIQLDVADYQDDFRPFFEMMAQQIAQSELPDGNSFEFSLSVPDEASTPEITLE